MGGLINYYHGEEGMISDVFDSRSGRRVSRGIRLQDNPHRGYAFDYGGDVLIDHSLSVGESVKFARLTAYDGIWIRRSDYLNADIIKVAQSTASVSRAVSSDTQMVVRIMDIWADEAPDFPGVPTPSSLVSERPATEGAFFLSYSSVNVLLARRIAYDLRYDAKLSVWLDLEQGDTADWSPKRAERWLREAVAASKGLVLLWSEGASHSKWVEKEIEWAADAAEIDPGFKLIVLQVADIAVPSSIAERARVINGVGICAINGMNEELVAALLQREGRRDWLQSLPPGHRVPEDEQFAWTSADFQSSAGVAVSLRGPWNDPDLVEAELVYESDGRIYAVRSEGESIIIDPTIKCGDRIASTMVNRAELVRFWPPCLVWMRSDDLAHGPESVVSRYLTSRPIDGKRRSVSEMMKRGLRS